MPDHLADYIIGIGDHHPTTGAHISSLDTYWDEMRPYAYGAAGNYVIPRAIEAAGATTITGVFSHRKIIVRDKIGKTHPVLGYYQEVTIADAERIPREQVEARPGFEFLVSPPVTFACGVLEHYVAVHRGIDMFEYVSLAVEMGLLTLDEAQKFATEKMLIPGGCELGVYATRWLQPILQKLANIGREFITRHAARIRTYDNYQVRAVGFLAERLGSFLLLSELRRCFPAGVPAEMRGYLCVIVPPGGTYYDATV